MESKTWITIYDAKKKDKNFTYRHESFCLHRISKMNKNYCLTVQSRSRRPRQRRRRPRRRRGRRGEAPWRRPLLWPRAAPEPRRPESCRCCSTTKRRQFARRRCCYNCGAPWCWAGAGSWEGIGGWGRRCRETPRRIRRRSGSYGGGGCRRTAAVARNRDRSGTRRWNACASSKRPFPSSFQGFVFGFSLLYLYTYQNESLCTLRFAMGSFKPFI